MTATQTRLLLLSACLVAGAIAFACSPSQSNDGALCINAVAGTPDGSVNSNPTWDGGTNSDTLKSAVQSLITAAGTCQKDADCVFLTDGGPFVYNNFTLNYVDPVALANVEPLLIQMESFIDGFEAQFDAGELVTDGLPSTTPQGEFCLQCASNKCVANLNPDAGL